MRRPTDIVVFGEVILDLIANAAGDHTPCTGGSPFNVALALARQDVGVRLLSPLSADAIGDRFAALLEAAGGEVGGGRSALPPSIALVWTDEKGQPDYILYRNGIADLDTTPERLAAATPPSTRLAHTGALTLTPSAVGLVQPWLRWLRAENIVVSLDVNYRSGATTDQQAYVGAIEQTLPLCDIVKLSDEDLRGMRRTGDLLDEAERILSTLPPEAGLVAVTAGGRGAVLQNRVARVSVPASPVARVVDTVGAGDCFQAGFLAALLERDLIRDHRYATVDATTLREVAEHAQLTAAHNVERQGCQPPTRLEVESRRML
jgi:fructokinase